MCVNKAKLHVPHTITGSAMWLKGQHNIQKKQKPYFTGILSTFGTGTVI